MLRTSIVNIEDNCHSRSVRDSKQDDCKPEWAHLDICWRRSSVAAVSNFDVPKVELKENDGKAS
jgi:hypothetical protein